MDSLATARTIAAYDRAAADFARVNAAMPANLAVHCTKFLARLGPEKRVVDVGCGPGRDMAWMEARGADVTGIDLSAGMLAQARQLVRGPLLRMDMRRLGLPDTSIDGIWCCAALLHLPKEQAPLALAEFHRVLVPGGTLYLGVQEGEGERWESGGLFGAAARLFSRYAPHQAEALLVAAGFTVDERARSVAGPRYWLSFLATAHQRE